MADAVISFSFFFYLNVHFGTWCKCRFIQIIMQMRLCYDYS